MPSPEIWGPPTWIFFHTLVAKVNEKHYPKLKQTMFNVISLISRNLPCPTCAREASFFISKINPDKLETKQDFINLIYLFHNWVNKKKKKPLFDSTNLNNYNNFNIYSTFNNFARVYHTKGNMQLLTESFQRNIALKELKSWIRVYGKAFR
jgi:hypothetical protein